MLIAGLSHKGEPNVIGAVSDTIFIVLGYKPDVTECFVSIEYCQSKSSGEFGKGCLLSTEAFIDVDTTSTQLLDYVRWRVIRARILGLFLIST